MKLRTVLDRIDSGSIVLPQFQRGYVWKRPDVSELMRSLYKDYPVGSLLFWETSAKLQEVKGDQPLAAGVQDLLLDGQQRVTSLYGIINGKAPPFCDGDRTAFLNLYFNVHEEEFEFYGPTKMKNNPNWVSVTELMQKDEWHFEPRFANHPAEDRSRYMRRMSRICKLMDHNFPEVKVTGNDKTMDVVVDIFNKVNSGGTKLSKGDLALAKICADWPQAREEMQKRLDRWEKAGYRFNLDWLLRSINALITGHADFAELDRQKVKIEQIQDGLQRAEKHIDQALNLISSRLGLDYHQVLGSPNAVPAIIRFFRQEEVVAGPHRAESTLVLVYPCHAVGTLFRSGRNCNQAGHHSNRRK